MRDVCQKAYSLLLLSVLAAGCAGLHGPDHFAWWSRRPSDRSASKQEQEAVSTAASETTAPGEQSRQSREAMHQVIEELHQLGPLDPEAQAALMEGLRETDPSLWPMVIRQFRAIAAMRKQAEQASGTGLASDHRDNESLPPAPAPPETTRQIAAAAQQTSSTNGSDSREQASGKTPDGTTGQPLQAVSQSAGAKPPAAEGTSIASGTQQAAGQHATPSTSKGPVRLASYDSSEPLDWKDHVDKAIKLLGNRAATYCEGEEQIAEFARLRLLQLVANRRDEALQPIEPAAEELQAFWTKELYGLATLLDTKTIGDADRRASEARRHLEEAIVSLAEASPLVVRNLAFVTDIQSYGSYTPFEKNEFVPGQRVLLYAEIENFKSNPSPKGYYTASRSSYQIFNSSGQRVAEHEFSPSEEYCRNVRRDFFIGYEFSLPERIFPGRHVLQLTVVDLNSGKIGQSMIEFTITSPEK